MCSKSSGKCKLKPASCRQYLEKRPAPKRYQGKRGRDVSGGPLDFTVVNRNVCEFSGDKRNVYPLQIKNGGPRKHTISFKPSLVCWWVPWGFTGPWERYLQARECLKHMGVTSRSHHSAEDDSGKLQTSGPRASVCRHNLTTALY